MRQAVRALYRPWLFLAPSTFGNDIARILAFSAAVQGFFLFLSYYCVPGGALEFFVFGDSVLHNRVTLTPTITSREIGYPLLLILSGYFYNGSLIGITLIQSAMAVLIPALIYLAMACTSRAGAYFTALASSASLAP